MFEWERRIGSGDGEGGCGRVEGGSCVGAEKRRVDAGGSR